ncbi:hypothetical protein D3C75_618910 [compost metagenome]
MIKNVRDTFQDIGQRVFHLLGLALAAAGQVMAGVHGFYRFCDPLPKHIDHFPDFARGLLGSLGQGTNFIGDYGKASTLFASPCGLDRGIECQQVGLLRDAVDHVDYSADLVAILREPVDGRD